MRRNHLGILLALSLATSACGVITDQISSATGDDGETIETGTNLETDETVVDEAEPADEPEPVDSTPDPADEETAAAAAASEESRIMGLGGPIRELSAFAAFSETGLHPFLVEVMSFPEEVPLPEGLVLTQMSTYQDFYGQATESSLSVRTSYLPAFDRDSFREEVPQLMDTSIWKAEGIDEDLEYKSTELSFAPIDPNSAISSVYYEYTDGDTGTQAELTIRVSGRYVEGASEIQLNTEVWGWLLTPTAEPSLFPDSAEVSVDEYGEDVYYSVSWEGPVGAYASTVAYYTANEPGTGIVKGEVEVDDDPWPSTDFDLAGTDGFDGSMSISEYDPDREIGVRMSGYIPMQ